MEQEIESSKAKDAPENVAEWGNLIEGGRAAVSELNARLEERAQDHIKASARDVAEIQRLRIELDALKRRVVKPLEWGEEQSVAGMRMRWQIAIAGGVRYEANYDNGVYRLYIIDDWAGIGKDAHEATSLDRAKRIAEDLHREAVLALLEKEVAPLLMVAILVVI